MTTSIVVLTGAGISAESGLKTFRGSDGLWEGHRIEEVASPEGFARNPELVQAFYNARRRALLQDNIAPNKAHRALADFAARFQGRWQLITQNIDDLHERAGSRQLIHMHGELLKARCTQSQQIHPWREDIQVDTRCPCCQLSGALRPHVVWFGEMPLAIEAIYRALEQCDLFVSIGTSGNVYPAAGFFQVAHAAGAHTVELNLEPSLGGSMFVETHYGLATEIVPAFFSQLPDR